MQKRRRLAVLLGSLGTISFLAGSLFEFFEIRPGSPFELAWRGDALISGTCFAIAGIVFAILFPLALWKS